MTKDELLAALEDVPGDAVILIRLTGDDSVYVERAERYVDDLDGLVFHEWLVLHPRAELTFESELKPPRQQETIEGDSDENTVQGMIEG
jgi:hypothetical protein